MNYLSKSNLVQLSVKTIDRALPDLKNINESKAAAIAKWLTEWIEEDLKTGRIAVNNLLPPKGELAYMLGVSIGTIQNALRYAEDTGCIESKQCIGTIIKNPEYNTVRKLTSKREVAIHKIKKFIKEHEFCAGQQLPSSRSIAAAIGYSANTTRLALEYLGLTGIIEHKFKNSDESGWFVKLTDWTNDNYSTNETLVEKIVKDLKDYITKNIELGGKMPAHAQLAREFKVSIKTIHDALKPLISGGILLARRGRYGTTVIKMPYDKTIDAVKETSIFAPAQETAFYYYEKTQNQIKQMIAQNYEIGSKLPSIAELSKQFDLSPNTIRKAFGSLASEGCLAFSRGRYGGTFVIDIPETDAQSFKWLAVNPQYAEVYK
ncbi:MAG: GntR family transcriptional regulator [Heliobacteriaceae bacterium]|jgi:DNA-binding GntR family transcriptional regulator|nr:GntR family transcriptional regulator [Heliobacteriaceae bacterium]